MPLTHSAPDDGARGFRAPIVICALAPVVGVLLGAITNTINGQVSPDYFAIVMSWDGATAPIRAIFQGMLEGFAGGLLVGFFFAIVIAASTRWRCPLPRALRTFALAPAIAVAGWVVGGVIGVMLSLIWPRLWGFVWVGVPPRVNLPRFAWVGGSIWGVYGGAIIGLIVASVTLHLRWRRTHGPRQAFSVLLASPTPTPDAARV